jgi:hypothetical protein
VAHLFKCFPPKWSRAVFAPESKKAPMEPNIDPVAAAFVTSLARPGAISPGSPILSSQIELELFGFPLATPASLACRREQDQPSATYDRPLAYRHCGRPPLFRVRARQQLTTVVARNHSSIAEVSRIGRSCEVVAARYL